MTASDSADARHGESAAARVVVRYRTPIDGWSPDPDEAAAW
jgi:hypothetical protein